jgi:hypothetical protein
VASPNLDDLDVADLLEDLEAKSLITATRSSGATRYRLLDTMRAYALDRLDAGDAIEETRQRHAIMRADLTDKRTSALNEPDQNYRAVLAALLADEDDIDAAFAWALDHRPTIAGEIFAALGPIIVTIGGLGFSFTKRFAETVAAAEAGSPFTDLDKGLAALVLVNTGEEQRAEALVDALVERPDLSVEARAVALAIAAHNAIVLRDDTERGIALAEEAIHVANQVNERSVLTFLRWTVPIQHFQAGNIDRAIELVIENDTFPGLLRDAFPGHLLRYSAGVCWRPRDLERSTALLIQCLEEIAQVGDTKNGTFIEYHLALNKLAAGDDRGAAEDLAAVLPAMVDRGQTIAYGLMFEDLALALARAGEPAAAVTAFAVADRQLIARDETGYEVYVRRRERLLPELRESWGEEPFRAAWTDGHHLTLDEAVRHMQALVARSSHPT